MQLENLPKISLIHGQTPFEKANRITEVLGGPDIYFKRDDMTGIGLGGNKMRKLEYLLGEAVAQGCTAAITTAAQHSNFLRVFSACCNRLKIKPIVFMRGTPDAEITGNYMCITLLGAEQHFINTEDPYSNATIVAMYARAAEEERRGGKAYVIHLGTFSGPLATVGYIDGACELFAQADAAGVELDNIYSAVGSGGTYAGLLTGARILKKKTTITGVSVNIDREILKRNILTMIRDAQTMVKDNTFIDPDEICILDDYKHPGYGKVNEEGTRAIKLLAETEGLILDPVYTGKAFAALLADVESGKYKKGDAICFLYTGGAPNLFAHGEELMEFYFKNK